MPRHFRWAEPPVDVPEPEHEVIRITEESTRAEIAEALDWERATA